MMLPLFAISASDSTLWTVWLVVWIAVGACWLLGWLLGRPWNRP